MKVTIKDVSKPTRISLTFTEKTFPPGSRFLFGGELWVVLEWINNNTAKVYGLNNNEFTEFCEDFDEMYTPVGIKEIHYFTI